MYEAVLSLFLVYSVGLLMYVEFVALNTGQPGVQPDYTQAWAEYYRQQGYYYPYQQQPGQPQQPGMPGQQPQPQQPQGPPGGQPGGPPGGPPGAQQGQ